MEFRRPKYSDIKSDVDTLSDLDAIKRAELILLRENYKQNLSKYRAETEALTSIETFILTSIDKRHLILLKSKVNVYQMLIVLKKRFAPTDKAREIDIII